MTLMSKLRSAFKLMAWLLGLVAVWELWPSISYFMLPAIGLTSEPLHAEASVTASVSVRIDRQDLPREQRLTAGFLGHDVTVQFTDRDGVARSSTARVLFWPPEIGSAVGVYYFEEELTTSGTGDGAAAPRPARALIDLPGLLYGRAAMFGAMALVFLILARGFGYFGQRLAPARTFADLADATLRATPGHAASDSKIRVLADTGSDRAAFGSALSETMRQSPARTIARLAALACFAFAGLWALAAVLSLWAMIDPSLDFEGALVASAIACGLFVTAGWYLRKLAMRLSDGSPIDRHEAGRQDPGSRL